MTPTDQLAAFDTFLATLPRHNQPVPDLALDVDYCPDPYDVDDSRRQDIEDERTGAVFGPCR